jgi:predicted Zn finger-like uncharacterized protein
MSTASADKMAISCPHCSAQFRVPMSLAGKKGRCAKCQGIVNIPVAPALEPLSAPVVQATLAPAPAAQPAADAFDDAFGDYKLMQDPPPASPFQANPYAPAGGAANPYVQNPYAPTAPADPKKYDGAFGMEKRAMDAGLLGGIGLMVLSVVWFFGGLMLIDRIFIYPPILFIIGFVACIRGVIGLFSK